MFVYSVKISGKNITKIALIAIGVIITLFFIFSTYKIISESFRVKDEIVAPEVQNLTCENYTNILKSIHDDPDSYYRKKNPFYWVYI